MTTQGKERPQMEEKYKIAKIESTMLGYEDHGILTAWLHMAYGSGSHQGVGGYGLDEYDAKLKQRVGHRACGDFIAGVLRACGVGKWEDLPGRTVYVVQDLSERMGLGYRIVGLAPLPTEPGREFIFESAFATENPSSEERG